MDQPSKRPISSASHSSPSLRLRFGSAFGNPSPHWSVIGIAATAIGGYPIFKEAVENIFERRMTMELSMTIALLAALLAREFFTALIITLFVLVAEVLEGLTVSRGRAAIADLLDLLPQNATLISDSNTMQVPISAVHPGDIVLVRPGERVPADGVVVAGNSFVDESTITGESMPAEKSAGQSRVCRNRQPFRRVAGEVEKLGRDSSFGKIIEAVEEAERSRAPIQKTADRLAGYLVYFALGCGAADLHHHSQRALHHFSGDRCRRLRHRCRHAACHSGGHRQGRSAGRHHQGRDLPGEARQP